MLKNKLICIVFLLGVLCGYSQRRLPMNSQYLMNNYFMISPSYIAPYGTYSKIRLTHRHQWLGLERSPYTTILTFQSSYFKNSAVGGYVFGDSNGIYSQKGGQLTYAYQINMKKDMSYKHALSFGLSFNLLQNSIDRTKLYQIDKNDPVLTGKTSEIVPDFNFGVSYNFKDFFASLAWFNILTANSYSQLNTQIQNNEVNDIRILASAGYLAYQNQYFSIVPSIFFNYSSAIYSFVDINVRLNFVEELFDYWFIISTRKAFDNDELSSISTILGLTKDNYHFGYNFELPLDKIMGFGTHQIMLGIDINFGNEVKKKKKFCGCPG